MKLEYSLTQDDFLQHQLFIASKSESIKKKRQKNWIWVTISFLCLGMLFYFSHNPLLEYYFLVAGILSLFFYPRYLKSYYKKHYQKFISENYKNRFDEVAAIIFSADNIETYDKTSESKINLSEIERVVETGSYIYLRLKSGAGSLIIPKLRMQNFDSIRIELQKLSARINVPYETELDWRWK